MKETLSLLSTRKKQACAALCLAQFCAANRIVHVFIAQLIQHLLSILVTDNLPEWESQGARLELTGRGDPIPQSVEEDVPEHLRTTFRCLIDSVVEVGVVDMHGVSSEEPCRFLCQCVDILAECGVELSLLEGIMALQHDQRQGTDGWGSPVSDVEYEEVMEVYRRIAAH